MYFYLLPFYLLMYQIDICRTWCATHTYFCVQYPAICIISVSLVFHSPPPLSYLISKSACITISRLICVATIKSHSLPFVHCLITVSNRYFEHSLNQISQANPKRKPCHFRLHDKVFLCHQRRMSKNSSHDGNHYLLTQRIARR